MDDSFLAEAVIQTYTMRGEKSLKRPDALQSCTDHYSYSLLDTTFLHVQYDRHGTDWGGTWSLYGYENLAQNSAITTSSTLVKPKHNPSSGPPRVAAICVWPTVPKVSPTDSFAVREHSGDLNTQKCIAMRFVWKFRYKSHVIDSCAPASTEQLGLDPQVLLGSGCDTRPRTDNHS